MKTGIHNTTKLVLSLPFFPVLTQCSMNSTEGKGMDRVLAPSAGEGDLVLRENGGGPCTLTPALVSPVPSSLVVAGLLAQWGPKDPGTLRSCASKRVE